MESPSTSENKSKPRRRRKPKSICLPFEAEEYQRCLDDHVYCRQYIRGSDKMLIAENTELTDRLHQPR